MKKQKLMVGLCVPAALVGATAGALGIIYALSQNKPDLDHRLGDYKVTFDGGNGRILSADAQFATQGVYLGDTLDKVVQPRALSNNRGYVFAGWKDENGYLVSGQKKFTRDTKLTADYVSNDDSGYFTVTFKVRSSEPMVIFRGNATVKVRRQQSFYMVNRPFAEWTGTGTKKFLRWVKEDGTPMAENETISSNISLYPEFSTYTTLEWQPGDGATITSGKSTTDMLAGTAFSQYNQPQIIHLGGRYFDGWYKPNGAKWTTTDIVGQDGNGTVAIAHWRDAPKPAEGYATLCYVPNYDQSYPDPSTYKFGPNAYNIIPNTSSDHQKWADIIKPTVKTTDDNWMSDGTWEVSITSQTGPFSTLTDEYSFFDAGEGQGKTKVFYIRPRMVTSITGLNIISASEYGFNVLPEIDSTFVCTVNGGNQDEVKLSLWKDEGCTTPITSDDKITINNGLVKVGAEVDYANISKFYIKGESTAKGVSVTPVVKEIKLLMPWQCETNEYNKKIWFIHGSGVNAHWYGFDKDDLCKKSSSITSYEAKPLNQSLTSLTVSKSADFTYEIHIGNGILEIPDYFLFGFTGFNGKINIENNDKITTIGSDFLFGCTKYNKEIDFLSQITSIGDNFLYGCESFNQKLTFSSNITKIGKYFLGLCYAFDNGKDSSKSTDNPLVLTTNDSNGLSIGEGFMYWCKAFNRNVTIASSVNKVEANFMNNCYNFYNTLTVNVPSASISTVFTGSSHDLSASTLNEEGVEHKIVNPGFTLEGEGAKSFNKIYATTRNATTSAYRTVRYDVTPATKVTETVWNAAVDKLFNNTAQYLNYTATVASSESHENETYLYNSYNAPGTALDKQISYLSYLGEYKDSLVIYDDTLLKKYVRLAPYGDSDYAFSDFSFYEGDTEFARMKNEIYTRCLNQDGGKYSAANYTWDNDLTYTGKEVTFVEPDPQDPQSETTYKTTPVVKFAENNTDIDSIKLDVNLQHSGGATREYTVTYYFSDYGTTNVPNKTVNDIVNFTALSKQGSTDEWKGSANIFNSTHIYSQTFADVDATTLASYNATGKVIPYIYDGKGNTLSWTADKTINITIFAYSSTGEQKGSVSTQIWVNENGKILDFDDNVYITQGEDRKAILAEGQTLESTDRFLWVINSEGGPVSADNMLFCPQITY